MSIMWGRVVSIIGVIKVVQITKLSHMKGLNNKGRKIEPYGIPNNISTL